MTLGSATNLDNVADEETTKERHQEKKKDGNIFKERKPGILVNWWHWKGSFAFIFCACQLLNTDTSACRQVKG